MLRAGNYNPEAAQPIIVARLSALALTMLGLTCLDALPSLPPPAVQNDRDVFIP